MGADADRDRPLARPKLRVYGFGMGMVRADLALARREPIATGALLQCHRVVAGYRYLDDGIAPCAVTDRSLGVAPPTGSCALQNNASGCAVGKTY